MNSNKTNTINKTNIKNKTNKMIGSNESINQNNQSITDEKMINDILENMGKKSKNTSKKNVINNFIENNKNIKQNKNENNNNENNNEKKKTYTETLTKEEIGEKLEDYKLVDDISKIPLDTHLRYFIKKDNEMLFRMGGNLKRNLDLPNFIVLKNAVGTEWTVQVKDTIFYKKMTIKEIKEEYENIIKDLHDKIKKLKQRVKELEK